MHLLPDVMNNAPTTLPKHSLAVHGISLLKLLEDANLDLARVPILGDRADDLDGHPILTMGVDGFDNLAERALAEETKCAI
jgi:hypothetical protein